MTAPTPEYSAGTLILCVLAIAGIIGFVIYAKMEDDRIYGPVREAHRKVELAEQAYVDTQREIAMESLEQRARANLDRIEERPPARASSAPVAARRPMSMQDCIAHIAGVADAIGIDPVFEINSATRKLARFSMADGDVRITCAGGEMISSHTGR